MPLTLPHTIVPGTPENAQDLQDNFEAIKDFVDAIATGIADNAVTQAKMADGSVGTNELINTNVTAAKLANGAVTATKIGVRESARVYKNATTALTNGVVATPAFTTERWDTGTMWDAGQPTRLTAARSGLYAVGGHAAGTVDTGGGAAPLGLTAEIVTNTPQTIASDTRAFTGVNAGNDAFAACEPATVAFLLATQYIELKVTASFTAGTAELFAGTATQMTTQDLYMIYLGPIS